MYKDKFVVSLKSGKKILREDKDTIYLPFGTEYSIFMKNLESRRAIVSISVDGEDVLDGNQIVVRPNSELELEGFMKGKTATNKFRFIQKTDKISEHRGDRIDDGLIRIEFQYEQEKPEWSPVTTLYSHTFGGGIPKGMNTRGGDNSRGIDTGAYFGKLSTTTSASYSADTTISANTAVVEDGITVKGSEVNQAFNKVTVDTLESTKHVIVLNLKGVKEDQITPVVEAVTVKTPKVCPTCGTNNKSINKYCRECSTYLN